MAERLGHAGADFVLERPRDAGHGDLATNLAMVLAKRERSNPRAVAARVLGELDPPAALVVTHRDGRSRLHQLLARRR